MSNIGRQVSAPKLAKETQSTTERVHRKDEDRYPSLYSFLHDQRDYGELHKTGSITIFIDGDKLKMVLNDRPTRKSCFISGDSFGELFAKADMGLESVSHNWTGKGYQRRSRSKVYGTTP